MQRAIRLRTPRLDIQAFEPAHAAAFVEVVRNSRDHLRPWMPFAAHEPSVPLFEEWFEAFFARCAEGDCTFGVWLDGVPIGGCGMHPKVGELGREVGYWIAVTHTQQGFASEALAAMCHLAFEQEGVDRVELRIEPENHASIAVAERAGFHREALLRRRMAYPGGEPRDVLVYTLFAADWPGSPGAGVPVERVSFLRRS